MFSLLFPSSLSRTDANESNTRNDSENEVEDIHRRIAHRAARERCEVALRGEPTRLGIELGAQLIGVSGGGAGNAVMSGPLEPRECRHRKKRQRELPVARIMAGTPDDRTRGHRPEDTPDHWAAGRTCRPRQQHHAEELPHGGQDAGEQCRAHTGRRHTAREDGVAPPHEYTDREQITASAHASGVGRSHTWDQISQTQSTSRAAATTMLTARPRRSGACPGRSVHGLRPQDPEEPPQLGDGAALARRPTR